MPYIRHQRATLNFVIICNFVIFEELELKQEALLKFLKKAAKSVIRVNGRGFI